MAFHHLAGVTTPGAGDEIVDWFATFEAWITATVGWIVAGGGGTTNLFIRSTGEAGGLTMLYVHLWRGAGANINRVYMEVCDDAVPTHETTRGGYVDSGGVQFAFWMSADKDAIVIVWKVGAGYRRLYGGLVMPFALTVPDETYHCIVTDDGGNPATILRRHDNLWDQDDFLDSHIDANAARFDRVDGSFPPAGTYFADNADIAGQLKHISCAITQEVALNPEDTLTTGPPGAETQWVVLTDSTGVRFAMRTGGVLPTGRPDGAHYTHATGVVNNVAQYFTLLVAHLTAVGWTATNYAGVSGYTHDYFFHSTGEDGTENIYIRIFYQNPVLDRIYYQVSDGIPGAHATPGTIHANEQNAHMPTQYYFSSDRDCHEGCINAGGNYHPTWLGKMKEYAVALPSTEYKVGLVCCRAWNQWHTYMLRDHGGVWAPGGVGTFFSELAEGVNATNSQPNNYDATTYIVWPHVMRALNPGGAPGAEMLGQLQYFFRTDGGGIANLDTITAGARVYTVFFCDAINGVPWAMRTT